MLLIGITGGIGTGKSTVTAYLAKLGYKVIDADEIAREIVKPDSEILKELSNIFGKDVLLKDGNLNRKKLSDIVFTDPSKKSILDDIMHKKIIDEILKKIKEFSDAEIVFIDVPLLYEAGVDAHVKLVWVVDAEDETRINRVMKRDKTSRENVLKRINSQMPQAEKKNKADYILDNSGDKMDLYRQVDNLLNKISE